MLSFVDHVAARVVDNTVSSGYLVAMALVCLVQYCHYLFQATRAQQENARIQASMNEMEGELDVLHKDRALARLENHIFREFVQETDLPRALEMLLRRFVVAPSQGIGAYLEIGPSVQEIIQSRGLSSKSQEQLTIDPELCVQIQDYDVLALEGASLLNSRLYASLTSTDRGKISQLFLAAIPISDNKAGLLLLSNLYPPGSQKEQQMELLRRLLRSLASNVRHGQNLKKQQDELRLSREMLELRAIADQEFDSPILMIETYLKSLLKSTGMDRASLFVTSAQGPDTRRRLVECGTELSSLELNHWRDLENRLLQNRLSNRQTILLGKNDLVDGGIDTLMGTALVVPLVRNRKPIGTLCLSRRSSQELPAADRDLIEWASGCLAERIVRALSDAAVHRRARTDGLTRVANRQTFDEMADRELDVARQSHSECALLLLDLDHFKSINDTYGHQAGDAVLRAVAKLLHEEGQRTRLHDRMVIARYGGEEFGILLPGFGIRGAERVAESILQKLRATTVNFGEHLLHVTASVGVSCFPAHAGNATELVATADAALYYAKESGRDRLCTASDVMV